MVRWMTMVLLGLLPGLVNAVDVSGKLQLRANGKALVASESAEAVVYFRVDNEAARKKALLAAAKNNAQLITRRKQFVPHILPIIAGASVQFPNQDTVLHNVFSTTSGNAFDSGLYGMGAGANHTFENPGLVKVFCNVHHSMFGYILVLDTPFFVKPSVDGSFQLKNLPKAKGELVVFHDRGNPLRMPLDLTLGAGKSLDLKVDLNRRKVPPHTNKFGKPYGQADNAYY